MELYSDRELLKLLPPLLTPDPRRGCQRMLGCFVVFLCWFGGITLAYAMSDFSSPALEIWQGWALVLAVLTFYVVIGLYIENSCVVERSPQNCLPIPKDVFECILEQRPMLEKNYEEDGIEYCVRCFVWRRQKHSGYHHCKDCQRCVFDFDHHCGVFGVCITGNRTVGNMRFFLGMIALLMLEMYHIFLARLIRWQEGVQQPWEEKLDRVFATYFPLYAGLLSLFKLITGSILKAKDSETAMADPMVSVHLICWAYGVLFSCVAACLLFRRYLPQLTVVSRHLALGCRKLKLFVGKSPGFMELPQISAKPA